MKLKKRKPPPDDPGNRAGRKLHARAKAWIEACGGVRIEVANVNSRSEARSVGVYKPPDDAQQKVGEILARKENEPKAKAKPKEKVSFFKFARSQR